MTPGRLAKWGLVAFAAYVVIGFPIAAFVDDPGKILVVVGLLTLTPAAVLLLAAGVAKVIQIGVRSARDDARE